MSPPAEKDVLKKLIFRTTPPQIRPSEKQKAPDHAVKQGFGQYWNITQEIEKADCVVHSLVDICNIL